jgi:hypothetical protein
MMMMMVHDDDDDGQAHKAYRIYPITEFR